MRYWIGIASKAHVEVGVQGSFCQLGHGKHQPVKRLSPQDWLIYYAPRTELNGGVPVQSFVALGQIQDGEPYQVNQRDDFSPWRRDVTYQEGHDTSIRPLLPALSFIEDVQHWGIKFRRSLFEISENDFLLIADAMEIDLAS